MFVHCAVSLAQFVVCGHCPPPFPKFPKHPELVMTGGGEEEGCCVTNSSSETTCPCLCPQRWIGFVLFFRWVILSSLHPFSISLLSSPVDGPLLSTIAYKHLQDTNLLGWRRRRREVGEGGEWKVYCDLEKKKAEQFGFQQKKEKQSTQVFLSLRLTSLSWKALEELFWEAVSSSQLISLETRLHWRSQRFATAERIFMRFIHVPGVSRQRGKRRGGRERGWGADGWEESRYRSIRGCRSCMEAEHLTECLMLTYTGSSTCAFCVHVISFIHVCVAVVVQGGGSWALNLLWQQVSAAQPADERVGVKKKNSQLMGDPPAASCVVCPIIHDPLW